MVAASASAWPSPYTGLRQSEARTRSAPAGSRPGRSVPSVPCSSLSSPGHLQVSSAHSTRQPSKRLAATLALITGSSTGLSVSSTRRAPSAAAARPHAPVPAPSSSTCVAAESIDLCSSRSATRARAAGHSSVPSQVSEKMGAIELDVGSSSSSTRPPARKCILPSARTRALLANVWRHCFLKYTRWREACTCKH